MHLAFVFIAVALPCGPVFIVKILSHVATAAQIHLMSGFEEQLKALL